VPSRHGLNVQGEPTTPDIRINEVVTEITVTEGVGSLTAQEVKQLVAIVLENVRAEQDRVAQRERDTAIRDRAYRPRIGD
jgi:hypothetical protein